MRKLFALLALTLLVIASGCTHNNGDIGPWFGQWKLVEMTIDGQPDSNYHQDVYFAFQSSVVKIIQVFDEIHYHTCFGSWSCDDQTLTLNFDNRDNQSPESDQSYTPPAVLGLPKAVVHLDVVKLSSSEIILRYTSPTAVYTYRLTPWG